MRQTLKLDATCLGELVKRQIEVALTGNLRDFGTTQLLNLVHLARKTGTLIIQVPAGTTTLFFREGKLLQATTGGRDGHLASLLARGGKLTKEQAEIIRTNSSAKTDRELGRILVDEGYVSQKDLLSSIRNDILETTYALFSWTEGLFRFEPNQLPPDSAITVPIDLGQIILEGSRRAKERERLEKELPDLNVALRFADGPGAQLPNTSLSIDEWRVIGYINPRNSIRQIAKRIGMDDLQIRRAVCRLLQAGLVELAGSEGAQGSRAPLPADAVTS